jgi:DNA-binding HxlR family transcriptional regulator
VSGDVDAHSSRRTDASSEGLRFAEGKWNLRIVAALLWKPMGFNQLSRALVGISQNTLANRLHNLEALGVITRTVLSVTPPATLYTVDRPGRELSDALAGLARWGERWLAPEEHDGGALLPSRWNDG